MLFVKCQIKFNLLALLQERTNCGIAKPFEAIWNKIKHFQNLAYHVPGTSEQQEDRELPFFTLCQPVCNVNYR